MKKRILIRTDGGEAIGLGHLVRCTALAMMLKEEFNITFCCREAPDKILRELSEKNLEVLRPESEDAFISSVNPDDIVVLDGYHFTTAYQEHIKQTGAKLVCIDDLHEIDFVADLVINHSPGISPGDYKVPGYTDFALGPDYALLRPAFLRAASTVAGKRDKNTVLICFGGSDPKNLSGLSLELVTGIPGFHTITVVTGSANPHADSIRALAEKDARIHHYHSVEEEFMAGLMAEAGLAIVPSSGILLEALASGCSVITGAYVENQKYLFEIYRKTGAVISAGSFSEDGIRQALLQYADQDLHPVKIIDGNSPERMIRKFHLLGLRVRKAEEKDRELLFAWANDRDVRKNAIHQDPIKWEDHVEWFKKKFHSPDTKFFILEFNKAPVGQLRLDKEEKGWLVDYSVIGVHRGMGFGKYLLKSVISSQKGETFRAMVRIKNLSSARVFESLGFKECRPEEINQETFRVFTFN